SVRRGRRRRAGRHRAGVGGAAAARSGVARRVDAGGHRTRRRMVGVTRLERTLRLGVHDLIEQELRDLAFELGARDESLEVTLSYDRDVATIDLGIEGAAGWRGWSGGARDRVVIRRHAATPGYLPGALEPGEWRVLLGL